MEGDESLFLLKFHCEYGIFFQCFEARTFQMFLLGSSFTLNLCQSFSLSSSEHKIQVACIKVSFCKVGIRVESDKWKASRAEMT